MILMQGQGVSAGVVQGKLFILAKTGENETGENGRGVREETERFLKAKEEAVHEINMQARSCLGRGEREAARLFEAHAMLAGDEDFDEFVREMLLERGCSAEYAVRASGKHFAAVFSEMEDEYLKARSADVRDVARRIMDHLSGARAREIILPEPVILAADDILPSETVRLDREKLLGFVMREGSVNSHTAILARSMGLPAVCGVGGALLEEYSGREAWLDGEAGLAVLDPDRETLAAFSEKESRNLEDKRLLSEMRGKEDAAPDGRQIDIHCNIASPEETAAVLANDGRGVGLFRSEFLFLARADAPGEEEQFEAYRQAVTAMKGMRVVIRTLDIGADKRIDYLDLGREENPALGLRGIRLCLNRPKLFRVQLRALYRASAYGKIAILFPLIASVWEMRECRRLCRQVMEELELEGIPYRRETEIGVMIETPASVLIADDLAREADFFSVGTNDLAQYMLACDRQHGELSRYSDPHHPALLKAVRMATDAAHRAGIWIGVCGELASDVNMLPFFLGAGIDELSVSPPAVLSLRRELRRCGLPAEGGKGSDKEMGSI